MALTKQLIDSGLTSSEVVSGADEGRSPDEGVGRDTRSVSAAALESVDESVGESSEDSKGHPAGAGDAVDSNGKLDEPVAISCRL